MDRTADFVQLLPASPAPPSEAPELPFYYAILQRISDMQQRLSEAISFRALAQLEEAFLREQREVAALLESIQIDGGPCLAQHYEGLKFIINQRLFQFGRRLRAAKSQCASGEGPLVPERAARTAVNVDKATPTHRLLERENQNIIQGQAYEGVRRQLMKIDAAQRAIHENLVVQEERIDRLGDVLAGAQDTCKKIDSENLLGGGSLTRRMATNVIVFLALILLFLHYSNR